MPGEPNVQPTQSHAGRGTPVRRDTLIADVLESRPDAARVLFEEFGLPCFECEVRFSETIEQGVSYTGVDPDAVVERLNACEPTEAPPPERPEGPEPERAQPTT